MMLTHVVRGKSAKNGNRKRRNDKAPIAYQLTEKGKRAKARTLGYHPMTDEWRISPWDCADPGRLTVAEARNVLTQHGPDKCGQVCTITRTARKVMARLIDAPTVRAKAFRIR